MAIFNSIPTRTIQHGLVPFVRILRHDARLLQQVLLDLGALDDTRTVEVDVDVLAEPGRVIVADRFRVTERFQDRVRFQYLLLDPGVFATDRGQILQDQLCTFRLAGARLARDDDALILPVPAHVRVRVVTDREDVRGQLADLALLVQLDLVGGVDRQYLVRVDGDQNRTGVCLKKRKEC